MQAKCVPWFTHCSIQVKPLLFMKTSWIRNNFTCRQHRAHAANSTAHIDVLACTTTSIIQRGSFQQYCKLSENVQKLVLLSLLNFIKISLNFWPFKPQVARVNDSWSSGRNFKHENLFWYKTGYVILLFTAIFVSTEWLNVYSTKLKYLKWELVTK